jgi:hypothetical protein
VVLVVILVLAVVMVVVLPGAVTVVCLVVVAVVVGFTIVERSLTGRRITSELVPRQRPSAGLTRVLSASQREAAR